MERVSGREAHDLFGTVLSLMRENDELKRQVARLTVDGDKLHDANDARRARDPLSAEPILRVTPDDFGDRSNRLHPFAQEALALVARSVDEPEPLEITSFDTQGKLGDYFTLHGSDKASRHSYASAYSRLIGDRVDPRILEIGIGSLNGHPYGGLPPAASLRAWQDAYPGALVVGADIDSEAVASWSGRGHVVDQTSGESLGHLRAVLADAAPFDLIVDDGFHDPHANVRTLLALLPLLADTGHYVIEDVHETLIDFWIVLGKAIELDLRVLDLRFERAGSDDNVLVVISA